MGTNDGILDDQLHRLDDAINDLVLNTRVFTLTDKDVMVLKMNSCPW